VKACIELLLASFHFMLLLRIYPGWSFYPVWHFSQSRHVSQSLPSVSQGMNASKPNY
jgi:hypothetical protein